MKKDERGQAYVLLLVALPLLLLLVAVIVDGGRAFYEYLKAKNTASLAAQAGAQSVDINYFRRTNRVILNIDGAILLERQTFLMNAGRIAGEVSAQYAPTTAEGRICVRTEIPTLFGSVLGWARVRPGACSRARPAYGIEYEGQ